MNDREKDKEREERKKHLDVMIEISEASDNDTLEYDSEYKKILLDEAIEQAEKDTESKA